MAKPGMRLKFVVLTALAATVTAVSCVVLVQQDAATRKARTTHLLDLLENASSEVSTPAQSATVAQAAQSRPNLIPEVPPNSTDLSLPIRVGLVSQLPIQTVELKQGTRCHRSDGQPVLNGQFMQAFAQLQRGALHCVDGAVVLNGRAYRGALDFIRREDHWIPVLGLDLEDYVASVVGAEMPSHWHPEALKAQAVAARSYALAHLARPAAADYHLGDTTRWQVFAGQHSRSRQTVQATRETRGIILSYRGGIVESLYAANQTISREAHGHLGASMSQEGAQRLARQGQRFNEILGTYYRGASLARLRRNGR